MDTIAAPTSRRSRRLLLPLGTMLAAGALIAGSGATFSSTTSSSANVVTAGAFTQTNSATDAAIFTMATAKPGDTVTGTAEVTNTGDFAGDFTLVESEDATNTFPEGDLDLVVTDITDSANVTPVYEGTIGALDSQTLGTLDPNESRTYQFVVTFDAAAGDEAQGDTASAMYTWNATQTDNA
ncbi:hypothetical protein [Citricoccus sp. GCM10030269]|uniref:hypothetical protein n=1 Tax=Citricoccus sp. GCM10030269 TaxID=3273388 RepID=UPI00361488EB